LLQKLIGLSFEVLVGPGVKGNLDGALDLSRGKDELAGHWRKLGRHVGCVLPEHPCSPPLERKEFTGTDSCSVVKHTDSGADGVVEVSGGGGVC
jgi:hypothetical protein